jgi:hypothetical protein
MLSPPETSFALSFNSLKRGTFLLIPSAMVLDRLYIVRDSISPTTLEGVAIVFT